MSRKLFFLGTGLRFSAEAPMLIAEVSVTRTTLNSKTSEQETARENFNIRVSRTLSSLGILGTANKVSDLSTEPSQSSQQSSCLMKILRSSGNLSTGSSRSSQQSSDVSVRFHYDFQVSDSQSTQTFLSLPLPSKFRFRKPQLNVPRSQRCCDSQILSVPTESTLSPE